MFFFCHCFQPRLITVVRCLVHFAVCQYLMKYAQYILTLSSLYIAELPTQNWKFTINTLGFIILFLFSVFGYYKKTEKLIKSFCVFLSFFGLVDYVNLLSIALYKKQTT